MKYDDEFKGLYDRQFRKLAGKPAPEEKPMTGKKSRMQIGYLSAGKWIEYFLKKEGIKAYDLQFKTHIPHQRIYDYIHDKRRLTVEAAILIEKAIGLKYRRGFLYIKQAEHDLYLYKHTKKKEEETDDSEQ